MLIILYISAKFRNFLCGVRSTEALTACSADSIGPAAGRLHAYGSAGGTCRGDLPFFIRPPWKLRKERQNIWHGITPI